MKINVIFENYTCLRHTKTYSDEEITDLSSAIYNHIQEFYDASNSSMKEMGYSKVELYGIFQELCAEVAEKKCRPRPIISKTYSLFTNEPSGDNRIPTPRTMHIYITVIADENEDLSLASKVIQIDPLPKIGENK